MEHHKKEDIATMKNEIEKLKVENTMLKKALHNTITKLDSIAWKIQGCTSEKRRRDIYDLTYSGDAWKILEETR